MHSYFNRPTVYDDTFLPLTVPAASGRPPRPVWRASRPPEHPPVDGTCPPAPEPAAGTAPAQWTSGPPAPPSAAVPVEPGKIQRNERNEK